MSQRASAHRRLYSFGALYARRCVQDDFKERAQAQTYGAMAQCLGFAVLSRVVLLLRQLFFAA
jgi:hypothetical protein